MSACLCFIPEYCCRPTKVTFPEWIPLTRTPCGICPVINECTPDGAISPATCIYFDKWLSF